jgi:trehalose synthase
MLKSVNIESRRIHSYEISAGREAVDRLVMLAAPLQGLRVAHVSATQFGGGVAEILSSEIPLLRDLGIKADWKIISADEDFFTVTKKIHNAIQGASHSLTSKDKESYLDTSLKNAQRFEENYDIVVVHDPQPLALLELHGKLSARWIWRCHIDSSQPNLEVWDFLRGYLTHYDAAVFTLPDFVPADLPIRRAEIIAPGIDPQSPKNIQLDEKTAAGVLQQTGLDLDRPIVTQVSRFDPWKDPLGVIAAYKLAKHEVPGLQLALVGSMADDDPEAWEIYHQLENASEDPDVHLLTNFDGIGNIEVNALQRFSNSAIQKSIREGFGLVVAETLWKETPIVASRTGGIPLQIPSEQRCLVCSVEECAEQIVWLLRNPAEAKALARKGRNLVHKHFLLTRMIADELRLYAALLGRNGFAR